MPLFQLDVYDHATVLVRRSTRGWSSSLVNPYQVAEVLSGVPLSTGLCGPDTLATGRIQGQPYVVTLIRPQAVTIHIRQGEVFTVQFQPPALVWGGLGNAYRLAALHERDIGPDGWPSRADIPTYHAPFGNVFHDTSICWGTGTRPQPATTTGMHAAFTVFLTGSSFNANESRGRSHAFPANILLRYHTLRPDQPYPCDDLVADGRMLDWMLSGGPWRNA